MRKICSTIKRIAVLLVIIVIAIAELPAMEISANEPHKTVKVGWYITKNFQEGDSDDAPKNGYGYEFLRRVAYYTGWEYEYVYGEWAELYEKLLTGEIDIMGGVSKTDERKKDMFFSDYEMGHEDYYIYKHTEDKNIDGADIYTLSGKTIASIRNNLLSSLLEKWLRENKVDGREIMFDGFEGRDGAFFAGEVDAVVAVSSYTPANSGFTPVAKIAEAPYYVAISKKSANLVDELNDAMSRIMETNEFFIDELQIKYYGDSSIKSALSEEEREWVEQHNVLRVGCLSDYLPYSGINKDGEIMGIIDEVFVAVRDRLGLRDSIEIEYSVFDNYVQLLEALNSEKVDVVFPILDDIWASEKYGLIQTNDVLDSSVYMIYKDEYNANTTSVVAASRYSIFQLTYIQEHYPDSQVYLVDSEGGCLEAVLSGKATCTVMNGGRAESYSVNDRYSNLRRITLGSNVSFCLGVKQGNHTLYSLLEKGTCLIDKAGMTNQMYKYIDNKPVYRLKDFLKENIAVVIIVLAVLIFVVSFAFYTYIWATQKEKKAAAEKRINMEIVGSLSRDYLNVYMVNTEDASVRVLKQGSFDPATTQLETLADTEYEDLCRKFIFFRVYEEDKPMMLNAMTLNNVLIGVKEKGEYVGEYRVVEDGEIRYYQYKFLPTEDGKQLIVGFRNIDSIIKERETQREKLEQALAETEKQKRKLSEAVARAEEASKAKTSFLFNMSHDIRTPMNAIIGYTELLKKKGDDAELRATYLEHILVSGNYLLDLINNVLDMSRIESGKAVLDETPGDTGKVGRSIEMAFEQLFKKKNLKHTFHDSTIHKYVYYDVIKTEQIMMNIISNAVKYTPDGGRIDIYFSEEPGENENEGIFQTIVQDTGIGISEEFLSHVFDQFSRERTVTENKIVGTGLGLGIVKKLVELMNGTIVLESKLGEGTKVTIRIPHRFVEKMPEDDTLTENNVLKLAGKRILLAEDNELNAEIAVEILKEYDITAEVASDGVVCIDMLTRNPAGYYDAILMDMQMPNMDGLKATSEIRKLADQEKADIAIIAMTANAFEEDKNRCMDAGMNGFVSKPIQIATLLSELAHFIIK